MVDTILSLCASSLYHNMQFLLTNVYFIYYDLRIIKNNLWKILYKLEKCTEKLSTYMSLKTKKNVKQSEFPKTYFSLKEL